jgi:L-cysteine desulfidase
MITSAKEARRFGPISDYIVLSRALDALIWQGIYNHSNTASIPDACAACNATLGSAEGAPWFSRFLSELEDLGYEVSAEGIVSW